MLRCTRTHECDGFGTIPAGSLWDADSPYVANKTAFEPVDADPKPTKKKAATKRAAKKGDD